MRASLALAFGLLWLVPSAARADGDEDAVALRHEGGPRVAIEVEAADEVDAFLEVFLWEIAATASRAQGMRPVEGARSAGPLIDCLERDACASEWARRAEVATLIGVRVEPADSGRSRVIWRVVSPTGEGMLAGPTGETTGSEGEVADTLGEALAALDASALPCRARLEIEGELEVRARVGDVALTGDGWLAPGDHRVVVEASGRSPWRGNLRCTPGHRLVLRVRVAED